MDLNATIGCIILAVALVLLVMLTLWCRRRVERIARSKVHSAREIEEALSRDG
jgi:hypothetical protein